MFDSISWQEFFTVVALAFGGYYVITALLLYSHEIKIVFKQKKSNHSNADTKPNQISSNESDDLMGGVRYESHEQQNVPREEVASIEELQVTSSNEPEESIQIIDVVEERLRKDFLEIQTEINALIEVISQGSTRQESAQLFKTLLTNYSQLVGTTYQNQTSEHIIKVCNEGGQFQFELNEINLWWTKEVQPSESNQ